MLIPEFAAASEQHYREYAEYFASQGFTEEIAAKLWPIMLTAGRWDAFHLFREAKSIPNGGSYCEIGGAWGGSLLCAFLAMESSGKRFSLTCIEQEPELELRAMVNRVGAAMIQGCSWEVAERVAGPIDLLVIDGGHTLEAVRMDIRAYRTKVRSPGVILCHDFDWWDGSRGGENHLGVVQAVMEDFGAHDVTKLKYSAWAKVLM